MLTLRSTSRRSDALQHPLVWLILLFSTFSFTLTSEAQVYPRVTLSNINYQGSFRVSAQTFGVSNMEFAEGPIEFNPQHNSVFLVGSSTSQAIAEFPVPEVSNSTSLTDLRISNLPLQVFSSILDRPAGGNPQRLDRIGGMRLMPGAAGPALILNAYNFSNPGQASQTSAVIRSPDNLGFSIVDGFFSFQGGPGHTAGWISPIPPEWRTVLGGDYITGASSGLPNAASSSIGPSAFVFNSSDIFSTGNLPSSIATTPLLDFSPSRPLASDLFNTSKTNSLWTYVSRAVYGVIIPNSSTYLTIGYSGGHTSGVCFQCTNDIGQTYTGYGAKAAADNYTYYWLWDMNDLLKVKNGETKSWDIRPYEFGKFPAPFGKATFGGASFDPQSGRLFLTEQHADTRQGILDNPPVIDIFSIVVNTGGTPTPTPTLTVTPTPTQLPPTQTPTPTPRPITGGPREVPKESPTPVTDGSVQKQNRISILLNGDPGTGQSARILTIGVDGSNVRPIKINGFPYSISKRGTPGIGTVALSNDKWRWSFQDSGGKVTQGIWGGSSDVPIAGCRFDGSFVQAVYNPRSRTVSYSNPSGKSQASKRISAFIKGGRILGFFCGDLSGDGADDLGISLLQESPATKAPKQIVRVIDLKTGRQLQESTVARGARPFLAPVFEENKATLGWLSNSKNGLGIHLLKGNKVKLLVVGSFGIPKEATIGYFLFNGERPSPYLITSESTQNGLSAFDLLEKQVTDILTASEFAGKHVLESGGMCRYGIEAMRN